MKKRDRAFIWFASASAIAYAAWFLALKYGSARTQMIATALAVVSPIPPVP